MSKVTVRATFILFLLLLSAAAQAITVKVVGVADGYTITMLDANNTQRKIRLDGIDAQESERDFGSRTKQSLSDMVFGKVVKVTSGKKDGCGRTVGKVTVDGRDINLERLNRVFTWFYRACAKELCNGET